jgi:Carbohydrate esterase, sialic acid-specific acetylesterase
MKSSPTIAVCSLVLTAVCSMAAPLEWDNDPDGVQVFILAGQSNMVGHGKAEDGHGDVKGAIGSLRHQVENDPKNYGHLVDKDGKWIVRDDVKVWWRDSDITAPRGVIKGDLKIGYSQSRNPGWFGPEYGFGWAVGEHFKGKPVLIVKIAWGGKSLNGDFRPPGAVAARGGEVGPYYKAIIEYTRDVLDNLDTEFPEWKGKGYRIAGIGWHQGWNDRVDATATANYEANLVDLIKDLRKEFGNPKLPFSITTTSMAPPPEPSGVELAQLAVADAKKYPEFKGNVKTENVRPFWRDASVSPSSLGYHWNHNGESTFLNGTAMGKNMVEMLGR